METNLIFFLSVLTAFTIYGILDGLYLLPFTGRFKDRKILHELEDKMTESEKSRKNDK
jgi:hypothetical protein